MSSEAENPSADSKKLAGALGLLLLSLVLFYALAGVGLLYRVLLLLLMLAGSVYLVSLTEKGRVLWDFMRGARVEVRKVVWPTRQETTQTTLIIFIAVIVAGIFFWLVDSTLLWAVRALTGQGG